MKEKHEVRIIIWLSTGFRLFLTVMADIFVLLAQLTEEAHALG
jgi:hypothetical protein